MEIKARFQVVYVMNYGIEIIRHELFDRSIRHELLERSIRHELLSGCRPIRHELYWKEV